MHNVRIVWNGNDYYNDVNSDPDAVSINSSWMVVNGSTMMNQDASDNNGNLYFWRTLLDRIGYATTPTSGYTESELGGASVRFHGPFQRRMLLGTVEQNSAGTDSVETGKWVHLMRYSFLFPLNFLFSPNVVFNILELHSHCLSTDSFIATRVTQPSQSAINTFIALRI